MLRRAAPIFACAGQPTWAGGHSFDATAFAATAAPQDHAGTVAMMFGGESGASFAGAVAKYASRPVDLTFPGADGFEVNSAVIGCGVESGTLFPDYEVKPT